MAWDTVVPAVVPNSWTFFVTSDAGYFDATYSSMSVRTVDSLLAYEYAIATPAVAGSACEQVETPENRSWNTRTPIAPLCRVTPWQSTTSSRIVTQHTAVADGTYSLIVKPGYRTTVEPVASYRVYGTQSAPTGVIPPMLDGDELTSQVQDTATVERGHEIKIYLVTNPQWPVVSWPTWQFPESIVKGRHSEWTSLTFQFRTDGAEEWSTITPLRAEFGKSITLAPALGGSLRVIATAKTTSGVSYTATSRELRVNVRDRVGGAAADIIKVTRSSAMVGTPMTVDGHLYQKWNDGTVENLNTGAVLQYQANGTSTWVTVANATAIGDGQVRVTVKQRADGRWRLTSTGKLQYIDTRSTPEIGITKVYYDQPGADSPTTNSKLNREYVVLKNNTGSTINLKGWTIRSKTGKVYTFTTTVNLGAGKFLTVHSGRGTATSKHRYSGRTRYAWNNKADTAYLRNASGITLDTCSWSKTGNGYKNC